MAVLVSAVAAILAPSPAHAITNGTPDGDRHPYVGAVVADVDGSGDKRVFCSGVLVAPHAVATTAHCASEHGLELDQVWVSFDPVYESGVARIYHGTMVPAIQKDWPTFAGQFGNSNPRDIAVIHLDEAPPITPGKLPTANLLDSLDLRHQEFTVVGYGATRVDKTEGPRNINPYSEPIVRNAGKPHVFDSLQAYLITDDQNIAQDYGGACEGDSGGPSLLGDSDVMVSLTMSGDSACRATARDYRLDTDFARQFLASQGVPVP